MPPAVVICLGYTGASVAQQLAGRLRALAQPAVQILLISGCPPLGALPGPADRNIQLQLAEVGARDTFRSPLTAHFTHLRQWLDAVPTNGPRIAGYVVASAAELEVELLSDVLVQLRKSRDRFSPLIGLLTLGSAQSTLQPALAPYIALRETGRFTSSGPHVVEDGPHFRPTLEKNSLLDHLVFCGRQNAVVEFDSASQVLSESLYALLNDCSGQLLQAELNGALFPGVAGSDHVVRAHTLGAKTVSIPPAGLGGLAAAAAQLSNVPDLCFANTKAEGQRYRMLIANNMFEYDEAVNTVFPFGAGAVNRLECGGAGLLSSVELQTNISFSEFTDVVAANQTYLPGCRHSCKQEENAQKYEYRICLLAGGAPYGPLRRELPAELVLTLYSLQMATIFFQSVITGLVQRAVMNTGWAVCSIDGFGELALQAEVVGDSNSLWQALHAFTLRLPYSNNPVGNPLHSATRTGYLSALHRAAKAKRTDPAFLTEQIAFRNQISEWRLGVGIDRVLGDFLDMLQVELQQPVWSGW